MLSLKHTLLSPCTPASGKPESQLEPGPGDFPAHFQGPLNLPDLVIPIRKEAGPSSLFWGTAGQLPLSVCPGPALGTQGRGGSVPSGVPQSWRGACGSGSGEQGGSCVCGRAQPRPSPVPTPNPLNGIKLAPRRPGREAKAGAGGWAASSARSSGSWHSLSLHLAGAARPAYGRTGELRRALCPGSLRRLGFRAWGPAQALWGASRSSCAVGALNGAACARLGSVLRVRATECVCTFSVSRVRGRPCACVQLWPNRRRCALEKWAPGWLAQGPREGRVAHIAPSVGDQVCVRRLCLRSRGQRISLLWVGCLSSVSMLVGCADFLGCLGLVCPCCCVCVCCETG